MDRNVILLFGGDSNERLVSVASAQAMAQAVGSAKLWFWHKEGAIFEIDYDHLIEHKEPFINEFFPANKPIFNNIESAIASKKCDNHIFLLGLHGGAGENGDVQELLERMKRLFTGSSAKASRIAFNKVATKECLRSYQIKMAPHVVIETKNGTDAILPLLNDFFDEHGQTILKPICGGSSLGCMFIRTKEELRSVAFDLTKFSPEPFMAEKVIEGREITVGVMEDENGPMGLPCTEIVLEKDRDFDYEGKYLGHGSREVTPAELDANLVREAQRMAVAAHAALSLDGYSRADMILGHDGFYFLETNTLPGLTKQSLVPQQLAAAGITMREFLTAQLKIACSRKF